MNWTRGTTRVVTLFLLASAVVSCAPPDPRNPKRKLILSNEQRTPVPTDKETKDTTLITGVKNKDKVEKDAKDKGLDVKSNPDDTVIIVKGDPDEVKNKVDLKDEKDAKVIKDQPINNDGKTTKDDKKDTTDDKKDCNCDGNKNDNTNTDNVTIDNPNTDDGKKDDKKKDEPPKAEVVHRELYTTVKRFGLDEFRKKNPEHDGRGVTIGIFDLSGINTNAAGLQKTSDGKNKIAGIITNANLFNVKMGAKPDGDNFLNGIKHTNGQKGEISEPQFVGEFPHLYDLNGDGVQQDKPFAVYTYDQDGKTFICVDVNQDQNRQNEECTTSFNSGGTALNWPSGVSLPVVYSKSKNTVHLLWGGRVNSLSTAVASVAASHNGPQGEGIAPGAQILEYNFWGPISVKDEMVLTISRWIKSIEELAKNGAKVITTTTPPKFRAPSTQEFVATALDEISQKYGVVFVFASGAQGPALGSQLKQAMYPNSALVVGATTDKDLDSNVTGQLSGPGLMYYNSRGPGISGEAGVSVVAPGTTIAQMGNGIQRFSNTLASSSAVAGLAAVMMSSLKADGKEVYPDAIVAALRLSAKPLDSIAYIEQGHGVPNINEAMKIYPILAEGKMASNVRAYIEGDTAVGGVPANGIYWLAKAHEEKEEVSIEIKPRFAQKNDFYEVDIEYSHKWMEGPKRIFANAQGGGFSLAFNLAEAEPEATEVFGEIRIKDVETKKVIKVIPVTLVRPLELKDKLETKMKLAGLTGSRVHFMNDTNAPLAVVEVKTKHTPRSPYNVYLLGPDRGLKLKETFVGSYKSIVALHGDGHHQFALGRTKGSPIEVEAEITITPLKVRIPNQETYKTIRITNSGSTIPAFVKVVQAPRPIISAVAKSGDNFTFTANKGMRYSGRVYGLTSGGMLGDSAYCIMTETIPGSDLNYFVTERPVTARADGKISVQCQHFDNLTAKDESSGDLGPIRVHIYEHNAREETVHDYFYQLKNGATSIPAPEEAGYYDVKIQLEGQSLPTTIGTVEVL